MQNWNKKTPDDFIFSVKASRIITHLKKFRDCEQLMSDLYNVCEQGLQNKLGCILFQLPPSIQYSEEMLNLVIQNLDPRFKNVVEFRHESWWKKKVYDLLSEANIIFCTVSHPALAETLIVNNTTIYVRLHGTPKMFYSNYDSKYLNNLHRTILGKKKIQEVYVYFNNTAGNAGILNAVAFKKLSDYMLRFSHRIYS